MSDSWLKCLVLKGMFNDELAVQITEKEGGAVSFFVPKDKVQGALNQTGAVRVRVHREGQAAWAEIPSEDRTIVPVNEADLAGV